ncbi:MAG TPA: DNA mismatch repair endonuclease MutL [Candidatus Aminicenantes bacterium]|nr:DNA mismatch repair endonuclease MutL [Candidatus Aminicenantes bacterium]HRY64285.1 DNA mismatch repair endonuclease MutL [Candidatus Aminicenantes bacterium]HRZ71198.1 DNA mismatch repair endonuclease MutL [Candidatus Aminicenantes bacterium]
MKKIHLLPEDVARKIAAGEVVERPVSVVKELVENALDAGAADIRIELADGGKRLIKVQDDGAGMDREDAALCFRRHSTSKISREEDLEKIATLGFRGEALASIAAVSRLTLRTFDGTGDRGTMIEREGERLVAVTDIAFPRGTTVEVRDLFFNLPARRKFLRSGSSELGPVAKYVTQAALGAPGVRFSLVHGTRETIACPPVATLRERVFQLFGKKMVDGLMDVAAEEGPARLEGLASLPLAGRGDKSVQYFFVNGRPVKDRILLAALNQAYAGILERGRSPEAFLFLRIPYEEVDVNVHPAKAEVRFKETQLVFRLVLRAVGEGASRGRTIKEVAPGPGQAAAGPKVGESGPFYQASALKFGPDGAGVSGEGFHRPVSPFMGPAAGGAGDFPRTDAPASSGPVVLGQYANTYIVAAAGDDLLVIDQHNAHERVLFEKFREIDRLKLWPRKALLIPPVVELAPSAAAGLDENAGLLEELGFRIEAMGGRSYALKEYPDVFKEEEARTILLGLLDEAGGRPAEDRRERMIATMACKAAVKAGEPLAREKMAYLVEELFKTSQPALCPHGRPVVVRIEKPVIDKGLGRKA